MIELQNQLIEQARAKYGEIFPCGNKISLDECFTCELGKINFWINTPDKSTRLVNINIPAGEDKK